MQSIHKQYLITESICVCMYVYGVVLLGSVKILLNYETSQKLRWSWRYLTGRVQQHVVLKHKTKGTCL